MSAVHATVVAQELVQELQETVVVEETVREELLRSNGCFICGFITRVFHVPVCTWIRSPAAFSGLQVRATLCMGIMFP